MNPTQLARRWRRARLSAAALVATVSLCGEAAAAKNVILMVADGAGENTWLAAGMYQGKAGKQVYDRPGWTRLFCSTYPLNLSHRPTGDAKQDESLLYDPAKAWDVAQRGSFAGYAYLTSTPTDSAAAATAMATGRKTYNNAINWSNDGRPMRGLTIAEIAKAAGKSVGVVTTVPWSDATPAALGGAHSVNRKNRADIANEMLAAPWIDLIMGAGNPDYDDDGRPIASGKNRDYQSVGGEQTWKELKSGKRPWKLIEGKADFEALATGPTPPKLLGTAQAGGALQENRGRGRAVLSAGPPIGMPPQPFSVPLNPNVPTLATMTRAAIHCLDQNPNGFYVMIEGGAVNWANHANQPGRMIEEQIDFVRAVETVVAWIESHGGWDETLLILSADHECGLLWGPKSGTVAFDPIVDNGPGKMPGMAYNSHGHSNSLVPLYARGPGSRRFAELFRGRDPKAAAAWRSSDPYIDNTDIFAVMKAEMIGGLHRSWRFHGEVGKLPVMKAEMIGGLHRGTDRR